MSNFKAIVSLLGITIPAKGNDGSKINRRIEDSSTNARNLEVIRLFDNGHCRVSSVTEVPKTQDKGLTFKVEFNTGDNLDVQGVIERFNETFVFNSITEVSN